MSEHKGKLRHGQQYDPQDDLVIPYTEQIVNTDNPTAQNINQQGDPKTEITPEDAQSYRVRVYDPPTEALDSFSLKVPGTVDLNLPDVLESISVTYNISYGNGGHTQDGTGISVSDSPSLNLALGSKSQASASIMPDIQPVIKQYWARNVPSVKYLFYASGNMTQAALLSRLTALAGATVNAWPKFQPKNAVFTLKGSSISVTADADVQQYVALKVGEVDIDYTWGEGYGTSVQVSTSTKTVVIPPTIHALVTPSGTLSSSQAATADANTGWAPATNWPARSATASITGTAAASVTPTSVAATTPVSAIPTSGLYLYRVESEIYKWGYNRVRAEVVDFANI